MPTRLPASRVTGSAALQRPESLASARPSSPPARLARRRPPVASVTQADVRAVNLALVARCVFRSPEPVSRADVAVLSGLTRSTVSRLVDDLVRAGVVAEQVAVADGGRGRPSVPLIPARRSVAALGLEVNVAHLSARVIDVTGEVLWDALRPGHFAASDPAVVLAELAALALEALAAVRAENPDIAWAGAELACPGIVDQQTGTLLRAPNLGWTNVRPADVLTPDLLGMPLRMGNEADYAALTVANAAPGRPSELTTFLYVSGETGIGGAIVLDGAVMVGMHGWTGELGHLLVDPDGPPCSCGARGCLEQYAGRRSLLGAAGLTEQEPIAALLSAPSAAPALRRAGEALGIALAGAVNLLDLPTVVLGGDLATLAPALEPIIGAQLERRVLSAPWAHITVTHAPCDTAPAARGAAYAALMRVLAAPASWADRIAGDRAGR